MPPRSSARSSPTRPGGASRRAAPAPRAWRWSGARGGDVAVGGPAHAQEAPVASPTPTRDVAAAASGDDLGHEVRLGRAYAFDVGEHPRPVRADVDDRRCRSPVAAAPDVQDPPLEVMLGQWSASRPFLTTAPPWASVWDWRLAPDPARSSSIKRHRLVAMGCGSRGCVAEPTHLAAGKDDLPNQAPPRESYEGPPARRQACSGSSSAGMRMVKPPQSW